MLAVENYRRASSLFYHQFHYSSTRTRLLTIGTMERCHGERRRLHGHTHAGPERRNMMYFRTPGPLKTKPLKTKIKEGLGMRLGSDVVVAGQ